MTTAGRLSAFAAVVAAVFGAALLVGTRFDPIDAAAAQHGEASGQAHDSAHDAGHRPGGVLAEQDGYRLTLRDTELTAGRRAVAFTIDGPDGNTVTRFDKTHDRRMHLVAVRRDFRGFQHVHPTPDAAGTWHASLALDPGSWRVFADFTPSTTGENLVLGSDVAVPGSTRATPPGRSTSVDEVDGYTVRLAGRPSAGRTSSLAFTATVDGVPVTDLQPYLGARGHLVVLREGDLGYLHVHPESSRGARIAFGAEVPSVGRYHLYLDFKHAGVVRTAEFVVDAR